MKKLFANLKTIIAVSLFIAFGIAGLEFSFTNSIDGSTSIELTTQQANARDYTYGYRMGTGNCPGGSTYERCWYDNAYCPVGDQTTCDSQIDPGNG